MRDPFGNIIDVVATVAKALRVTARGQIGACLPRRRGLTQRIQHPRRRGSATGRQGSHRYDLTACIACDRCARSCPAGCIHVGKEQVPGRRGLRITVFTIDYGRCLGCGLCGELCPTDCIALGSSRDVDWHGSEKGVVDFSRLPVEVAWGHSTVTPFAPVRLRTVCRSIRSRRNPSGN